MHVDIPIFNVRPTLDLFANESWFYYADMDINTVTGKMESLTIRLDTSLAGLESAEDSPKIQIFPSGNFIVDFLGKKVEWEYNFNTCELTEIGNDSEGPVKIASWDVCDYTLAFSIANYGSPELQTRNLDFLLKARDTTTIFYEESEIWS